MLIALQKRNAIKYLLNKYIYSFDYVFSDYKLILFI